LQEEEHHQDRYYFDATATIITEDGAASAVSCSCSRGESSVSNNHYLRADQYEQWKDRCTELLEYKQEHGDYNVPYHWKPNSRLSQWVKRQRHQYTRLKAQGKYSNLSDDRHALLEAIDFIWDSRACNWENRFEDL
jgi:hypothetical protein